MKYRFADIVIDCSAHCVMRRAQVVRLTNIEFRWLEYLAQNADQICSREDILNHVWGQQFQYDTGTIDVHLHSLRRKLDFDNQYPIESIRNVGILLHTQPKQQLHTFNIQEFAIQWITDYEADFQTKQLTPRLHLDPFVRRLLSRRRIFVRCWTVFCRFSCLFLTLVLFVSNPIWAAIISLCRWMSTAPQKSQTEVGLPTCMLAKKTERQP